MRIAIAGDSVAFGASTCWPEVLADMLTARDWEQAEVLNCGICAYDFEHRDNELCVPNLVLWNHGAPFAKGEPQTAEPDSMTGTR